MKKQASDRKTPNKDFDLIINTYTYYHLQIKTAVSEAMSTNHKKHSMQPLITQTRWWHQARFKAFFSKVNKLSLPDIHRSTSKLHETTAGQMWYRSNIAA